MVISVRFNAIMGEAEGRALNAIGGAVQNPDRKQPITQVTGKGVIAGVRAQSQKKKVCS